MSSGSWGEAETHWLLRVGGLWEEGRAGGLQSRSVLLPGRRLGAPGRPAAGLGGPVHPDTCRFPVQPDVTHSP